MCPCMLPVCSQQPHTFDPICLTGAQAARMRPLLCSLCWPSLGCSIHVTVLDGISLFWTEGGGPGARQGRLPCCSCVLLVKREPARKVRRATECLTRHPFSASQSRPALHPGFFYCTGGTRLPGPHTTCSCRIMTFMLHRLLLTVLFLACMAANHGGVERDQRRFQKASREFCGARVAHFMTSHLPLHQPANYRSFAAISCTVRQSESLACI